MVLKAKALRQVSLSVPISYVEPGSRPCAWKETLLRRYNYAQVYK